MNLSESENLSTCYAVVDLFVSTVHEQFLCCHSLQGSHNEGSMLFRAN